MSSNQDLTFSQLVNATPKQAYYAFTNSSGLREWLSDEASAIAKPGGRLYLWWNDGYYTSGEFISLAPEKEIVFSWRGKSDPDFSQVKVVLSNQDGGALLNLDHTGIGSGDAWGDTRKEMENGWKHSLENLASVLETGEDLRFVNRPMLGITLDDFNAEVAERLGVPVTEGIRIDGVVEGMGAQAAGLKADDVIVGLAGEEVNGWPTLTNALQGLQAGDKVEVVFYRGSEKQSVNMGLSRRPIPDIPETPEKLAKIVEEKYADMESELNKFFVGVSEDQAGYKPAADVWSIKEIIAHLIHTERGWHTWINDLVGGFEPIYDDWGANLQSRVAATVTVYPTIPDLREALRRECAETVAFLTRLPEDLVARRGSYWRLSYNMVEAPYHFNLHLEQMRSVAEAAKTKAV